MASHHHRTLRATLRGASAAGAAGVALALVAACYGQLRFDDAAGARTDGGDATPGGDEPVQAGLDARASEAASSPPPRGGCATDPDCKLPSLHCDAVSGACVACVVDAHCSSGAPRCDVALHRCVACGIDGDCQSGEECEATARRCVRSCQSITGCQKSEPFCDISRGFCVRCVTDLECVLPDFDFKCDTASGRCVECVDDGRCRGSTPRCDRLAGTCAQCITSSDCPTSAPLCNPTTRTCVGG